MSKETEETKETDEDLESTVRKTFIARARAHIFADIGVHLSENQIINYCLNYTLNSKTKQSKN